MEKVILKAQRGTVIEIDACREIAAEISPNLTIGFGKDGIHFALTSTDGTKRQVYKSTWEVVVARMFQDSTDRWREADEKGRIQFLQSIGAVFAGVGSSGPAFLVYPRTNA